MANSDRDRNFSENERNRTPNRTEQQSSVPNDLPDSPRDAEHLKNEETFIELPDVSDIPGQENVSVPPMGELADTTIASDDEEGVRVFGRDDSEDFTMGTEADVTREERRTLASDDYMPTKDEDKLIQASMDNTDFQGESLNEKGFGQSLSGKDLDVPGSEVDNANERIGEEDEENNEYSISDNDDENNPPLGTS
ncbi:hypothetical protein OCK74_01180 [Chitinophagaceae bacterium LB-8]|jgi:hypothetical protein|uniref:Uncharacterized protein n=1 Tax=Paraflavisolibacter caeni TaxID=2982496 RepID=A0A9X3B6A1_9BACT|nr:hypothetical protein [Paraflavisolibacter caeni]MCU7547700.1 hypothetical protein [Paraflavisolibacter caeni]